MSRESLIRCLPEIAFALLFGAGLVVSGDAALAGIPKLLDAMTIVSYVYLAIYAFAILLISVCYVNLSAKRLRDGGWPTEAYQAMAKGGYNSWSGSGHCWPSTRSTR